jgi:hypothetical protein
VVGLDRRTRRRRARLDDERLALAPRDRLHELAAGAIQGDRTSRIESPSQTPKLSFA